MLSWKSLPNIKSLVVIHFRTVMKFPRGHAISKNLVRTTKECIKEFIWINLQDKKKCLRSSHLKVSDYDSFINCKSSWNILCSYLQFYQSMQTTCQWAMKKRSMIKQIVEAKVRSQFTIQPIITSKLDPSYRYSLNW